MLRICNVKGKGKALFHKWIESKYVIEPSLMIGGSPGGQVSNNFALVELEDGAVTLAKPQDITFLDNEFANYYFGGENDK